MKTPQSTFSFRNVIRNHDDAIILELVIAVVYGACAVVPYVLWDDYGQLLYNVFHWTDWRTNGLAVDGRPIASWLVCKGFFFVGSLPKLYLLRLAAFVGASGFGLYFLSALKRLGFSRIDAFVFAALAVLTPGMGEYVGWTVSWPYPFVLLFVAWLSVEMSGAVENAKVAKLAALFCATCVALQIVLLTYQTLAGFLLVVPFLLLLRDRIRPLVFSAAAVTLSFAIYRFATFPALHLLSPGMGTSCRARMVTDLPGHLVDVLTHFVPYCASSWSVMILPPGASECAGWLIFALAVAGFVALVRRWKKRMAAGVAALALFSFALSAPQVFLLDDIWAFRTFYPMAVLLAMTAWVGFSSLLRPAAERVAAGSVVLVIFLAAAWCVNVGIVHTASREYGIVRNVVREIRDSGAAKVCVISAPTHYVAQPPVPLRMCSCYGYVSIILMRDFEVWSVLCEEWPAGRPKPVVIYVPADDPAGAPQGVPVFDLWGRIMGRPSPAAR
jgi:hypothetical protein